MAANFIRNKDIYEFYKSNGKTKRIEYMKENDINCNTENVCAGKCFFYEYSLKKLIRDIDSYKKGLSMADTKSKYDTFIENEFVFPKGDPARCGPYTKTDESLNLKQSPLNEKLKTEQITKKLVLSDGANNENIQKLEMNEKLKEYKLKLKRTAARETYIIKKVQKLEAVVNDNKSWTPCQKKHLRSMYSKQALSSRDQETVMFRGFNCQII